MNQIPPKPKRPLKSQNEKNVKKHHFLRISVIFGVMILFCPKLHFFWQQNPCLYLALFWFSNNLNYPPKIQIWTNVKKSPPQEKKMMMMFLFGSKMNFKGCFWFQQHCICGYLLLHLEQYNCVFVDLFLTPLNAFQL